MIGKSWSFKYIDISSIYIYGAEANTKLCRKGKY